MDEYYRHLQVNDPYSKRHDTLQKEDSGLAGNQFYVDRSYTDSDGQREMKVKN